MSELPEGIPQAEPPAPRDSASGIVVRRGPDGRQRALLAVRSRTSRFMPGHLAFPGGAVDAEDRDAADAFTACVAREIEEETGLTLPAGDWLDAGRRITPPMFPVRFDNRFFVAAAPEAWSIPDSLPSPEEIERLEFVDPREVLESWARGEVRLAPPVMPLLRGLVDHAEADVATLAERLTEVNRVEQRAPRIEFCPDVWMLPVRTATLPPATHTNVWLPGGERFVVVDPGCRDTEEQQILLEVIERRRAAGSTPVGVVLTHGHRDHVGGAGAIARALDVPISAHRTVLDGLPDDATSCSLEALDDGASLDLGGLTLVAHLTPGHAPGHLAFHVPERGVALAGDLLSGISTILIDPEQGDMGDYLRSLKQLRGLGCKLLFPGHGPPLPGKAPDKLIRHRREREARIVDQLGDEPVDLSRIAQAAYSEVPEMPAFLTERQALSHLLLLERAGRAQRADTDGRTWRLQDTAGAIERILRTALEPVHFELRDDSEKHYGHAGAAGGGGHYRVKVVSPRFEGLPLLDRHRLVNDALRELFGARIHALALKTLSPSEWSE